MPTTLISARAAATLLATADSPAALHRLAQQLGFTHPPHPINDPQQRQRLGINGIVTNAWVTRATGSLRLCTALLCAHDPLARSNDPRELTRKLACALARHAPLQRWCLITLDATHSTLCIATVTHHPTGPRVAALRINRHHVVDSDADTLRSLAAVTEHDDTLRHTRFTDILRRDNLSARFYRALEQTIAQLAHTATSTKANTRIPLHERHELALLCASRCLFLAFLQAKGWLDHDHDFLLHHATTHLQAGGNLHQRFLRPLFFGTLNTHATKRAATARAFGDIPFLNGGLFAPTRLEKQRASLRFSDDAIVTLIGELLDRYRFTAHEHSTDWSEAAIDPEMLGRAFECLMASDERRRSGSFYTPPLLVDQVVHDALHTALPHLPPQALDPNSADTPLTLDTSTRRALHALRILDPACGSGAFLVHAMERISDLHARSGDTRALHLIRRDVLTRTIFGVDRNPVAVWLCELRLWLSVVIECAETRPSRIPPLPNLDHNIRVGDTLSGGDLQFTTRNPRLGSLRERYARATGTRKHALGKSLQHAERTQAIALLDQQILNASQSRADLLTALRTPDLFGQKPRLTRADRAHLDTLRTRHRELIVSRQRIARGGALPFRFATHFATAIQDQGFTLVIGNPPWVRPHALAARDRTRLRAEYQTLRDAAWQTGAKRAGATLSFAAQADLAAAFIERSIQLLAPGGTLALLVPAKLWRALSGGGVRRYLAHHTTVVGVHDWSDAPPLFDAATYPSLVVAKRNCTGTSSPPRHIHAHVSHGNRIQHFTIAPPALALDEDSASPWILLPHNARHAFERLRIAGPALGDTPLGRPLLGVKCGCNAAFLVNATESDDELATISADGRTARIERQLLRPVLRGESLGNGQPSVNEHILWTHQHDGTPLRALPPGACRWLSHWRPRLETRRDARNGGPWWRLFRTEAARADSARLVWADIGKSLHTRVLSAGDPTVPLNSCYVLRTNCEDDAHALNAILSSPVAAAWLHILAEPARGGFRRYMGWTIALLPLPHDWLRARFALATLGRCLALGRRPTRDDYIAHIADAYGIHEHTLLPLIEWNES